MEEVAEEEEEEEEGGGSPDGMEDMLATGLNAGRLDDRGACVKLER